MQSMVKCTTKWGDETIKTGYPDTVFLHDAIYMPNGEKFGIYDSEGRMVPECIDFRGPQLVTRQSVTSRVNIDDVVQTGPAPLYIYCGVMNAHFGHFIVNSLSRLWNVPRMRGVNVKFLYHGADMAAMYRLPFVKAIVDALGVSLEDFVTFNEPTRLRNVLVGDTSFEEQRGAYSCFRDLCLDIGRKISPKVAGYSENRPIYYSKSRLASGVGGFANETEIENVMAEQGVDIIYPETLSLHEQIALLNSRRLVFGTAGSFLHNTIFCESEARFVIMNPALQINTNFSIIDKLAGNLIDYYYPTDMEVLPPDTRQGFLTLRFIPNARRRAEEMLSLAGADA